MHNVYPLLEKSDFPNVFRDKLSTVQINLGYKCNQSCLHCHVNAGPKRKEQMNLKTINDVIKFIKKFKIKVVDLTGGAPELNKNFEYIVEQVKAINCHVIDRCNLTILLEKNKIGLANFLRKHEVEIIASLPCYEKDNVNSQRGENVFEKSLEALKILNSIGYGNNPKLQLNLVYNPQGFDLPPNQKNLTNQYKKNLKNKHNIVFNNLYTITNMPIARFGSTLVTKKYFSTYMNLLKNSFEKDTLKALMCRSLVSIDYLGFVYDCDFNQMLNLNISANNKKHITEITKIKIGQKINTADHCYGCTAGSGSSCSGSLL
jgi:radical SAM/Cys-rich protein|tara:strand:- start:6945 stop:7895 length:951 start_codon:yes stop_codon:yes gene_type:complete